MKKRILSIIIVLLLFLPIYSIASAHSGRTDSSGGHNDYNNASGLGSYHYHHGYPAHLHPNGVCPYDSFDLSPLFNISAEDDYDAGYEEGYDTGYDIGYDEGYGIGHKEGYKEGNEDGRNEGLEEGYQEGLDDGASSRNTDVIVTSALSCGIGALVCYAIRNKY